MRIATCLYHFTDDETNTYENKLEELMLAAKNERADLVVLPEYIGMQSGNSACTTDVDLYASIQPGLSDYLALFSQFAVKYGFYIQAGTTMVATSDKYYNRAYLFAPDGKSGYQDKLQLTSYEKESQLIVSGTTQTVFSTAFGKIGIAICYDSEFPEIVRALTLAGANLILVPSYTTTMAGYYRVQLSCRARAIENQCYIAMSAMHGHISIGDQENTTGAAGIYGPAEMASTPDGILVQGEIDQHGLIYADLDMNLLSHIRTHGDVHNYRDFCAYNAKEISIDCVDL